MTGNLIVEQVIFASHSPDIERHEQQILSGRMPSELNEASLIAYANVSSLVDEFAGYLESFGLGIMEGPSSGFETIRLLKTVGIKSLSDLDNVLRDSQSWGRDFLKHTFVNSQPQPPANQGAKPIHYVERIRVIDVLIRKRYGLP